MDFEKELEILRQKLEEADKARQEADRARREEADKARQEIDRARQEADRARREEADKARQEIDRARQEADRARREEADKTRQEVDRAWEEARQEIEKVRQEADKTIQKSEKALAVLERQTESTTYSTYLDSCHRKYFLNFTIEEKSDLVTTGKFTKVDGKYYPFSLQKWTTFDALHEKYQTRLEKVLGEKRVFPSLHAMDGAAKIYGQRFPAASEQDIADFENTAVETWVMVCLVEYLTILHGSETGEDRSAVEYATPNRLPRSLLFRSYAYGIYAVANKEHDAQPAYISAMNKAMRQDMEERQRLDGDSEPPKKKARTSSTVPRKFYPDKWLLRSDDDGSVSPILVMEYKAAHKLRAHTVRMALADADNLFKTAIQQEGSRKIEVDEDRKTAADATKATARVLVQAFHYMIEFGLCYSYVTSGEALILLCIDSKDPRTLYYHFCVPGEESFSQGTEESASLDADGAGGATLQKTTSVRHTAVALVLTMALLALDAPAMTQRWKRHMQGLLAPWPEPYKDMSFSSESQESVGYDNDHTDDDGDDSGDHVPGGSNQGAQSTLGVRTYATRSASRSGEGGGSSGGGQTRQAGQTRQYCTQACLLGLRNNDPLDPNCPNYSLHALHGRTEHASPASKTGKNAEPLHGLSMAQFAEKLRAQLADSLDDDCDALDKFGKFGAIGMLFRLTLRDYGYCVSAKGVQKQHMALLKHEQAVYEYLQAKQGDLVPVCLGMLELVVPYWTSTGAHVSHMLLLSYGGEPLDKAGVDVPDDVEDKAFQAWAQLKKLGVDQGDEREPNVLWNVEQQRVMCIDFDRAEPMVKPMAQVLAQKMGKTGKTGGKRQRMRRAGKTSEVREAAGTALPPKTKHALAKSEEQSPKRPKRE